LREAGRADLREERGEGRERRTEEEEERKKRKKKS
jgi:hypothetical protein